MTYTKRELVALLDLHGLQPKRSLGQNFVVDPNVVRKIARLAEVGIGDHVVEIGAGVGSLSLALLETGAELTCVELDDALGDILAEQVEPRGARVIHGDAMALDWANTLSNSRQWTLVANLPYNIATPLVCDLLDARPEITKMVVMVQREVAERFVAKASDTEYGAVSVKIDYWADAKIVGRVPPSVFVPQPKVDSAVVSIVRHDPAVDASVVPPQFYFSVVQRAFNQRRKQLQKSLRDVATLEDFSQAEIDPAKRPQDLDVDQWGRLTACIYQHSQN